MSKNEFTCDCNIIHKDSVNHVKKNIPNEYILMILLIYLN